MNTHSLKKIVLNNSDFNKDFSSNWVSSLNETKLARYHSFHEFHKAFQHTSLRLTYGNVLVHATLRITILPIARQYCQHYWCPEQSKLYRNGLGSNYLEISIKKHTILICRPLFFHTRFRFLGQCFYSEYGADTYSGEKVSLIVPSKVPSIYTLLKQS